MSLFLLVVFLFYVYVEDDFSIRGNMGQVGDFIGGLTNPILSFVALIVLLRTTLIQTGEARKTAEILLEQHKLLQEERFESAYYALYDRLHGFAEKNLRNLDDDGLTELFRLGNELRQRRLELNGLGIRERYFEAREVFLSTMSADRFKRFAIFANRIVRFIDDSNLTFKKKQYYIKHFLSSIEPTEQVFLLEVNFFNWPVTRKRLRKYRPALPIRMDKFIVDTVFHYFSKKPALVRKCVALSRHSIR